MTRNDKMIELKNLYKKIKQISSIKSENNQFLIVNYKSDEHAMMNSTTVGSYGGTGGSYGGTAGTADSSTNSTAGTMNTTNGINGSTGSSSTGKHLITINNDKLIIKKLDNAIANSATMNNNNNDNIINNNNNVTMNSNNNVTDGITSMHDSPAATDELVIDFNDVFITCFQFISCRFKNVKKSNCKIIVSLINGFVYCFDGDKIMNQFTNDTSIDTMDHISIDIDYNLLWKIKSGHEAIILCMATSEPRNQNIHYNSFQENQQKLFATGSADSIIKVWDLQKGYQTHNLKGHAGIISALAFGTIPSSSKDPWILASASDDCSIRIWDLKGKSCLSILQDHVSVVRELAFTDCGSFLVSGGRDKVFIKWSCKDDFDAVLTVPIYESIESLKLLQLPQKENGTFRTVVCTGGETGALKIWDFEDGTLLHTIEKQENASYEISASCVNQGSLYALTSDQIIQEFKPSESSSDLSTSAHLVLSSSISAYSDQVLNVRLLNNNTELLVSTNANFLKCYNLSSSDCSITYGHSDIILAVTVSIDSSIIATGSKDGIIIVWERVAPSSIKSSSTFSKIAELSGHTSQITSLAFPPKVNDILWSASMDKTIKKWNIKTGKTFFTFIAHENDITDLKVSPNASLVASSSLDKTAKLWTAADGSQTQLFKGHKRGISALDFSPIDQALLTASADKTLKLWSLRDGSCLKTFEGHSNSILNCQFLASALQFVSSSSDGLLKVWNVSSGECSFTLDGDHEDKIWALDVGGDDSEVIVSGSASDAKICVWKDYTDQERLDQEEKNHELLEKQNDLNLHLKKRDFKSALIVALDLDQSFKCLEIFTILSKNPTSSDSVSGDKALDGFLTNLQETPIILLRLLKFILQYTTSPKHTATIQPILSHLLSTIPPHVFTTELGKEGKEVMEGILVYSKRHYERVTALIRDTYLIDHLLERMNTIL